MGRYVWQAFRSLGDHIEAKTQVRRPRTGRSKKSQRTSETTRRTEWLTTTKAGHRTAVGPGPTGTP